MIPHVDQFSHIFKEQNIDILIVPVQQHLSESDLMELIEDIDGVICGDDHFTKKVLEHAKKLKVISKWGTGVDSIDRQAADELGIRIFNTPGAFADAVADSVMGYILNFSRQLFFMDSDTRSGKWNKRPLKSLKECTLGVIGVGHIGQAVIQRAIAFGMRVKGHDIVSPPENFMMKTNMESCLLKDLLQTSDFVSLNCDLNPTSHHLISQSELKMMKFTAYLINTSRGSVIKEAALIDALETKMIAGAALDVFEREPLPTDSPLRKFKNCLLAPHNANNSPLAWQMVHESSIDHLITGLNAEKRIHHVLSEP